jgi:MFS transporter, DHA1 family, multidrug resistance protein
MKRDAALQRTICIDIHRLFPMSVQPSLLLAFLIVALTSVGPLSTDFYLPALPAIAQALGSDSGGAQLTLSAYMIGFGSGQLIIGPLSDRYGRRPVMMWGTLVFVLASAACALAGTVETLVLARFVQALGACVGPVLGRAVVRDVYGPHEAARVLSHVSTATALAPLLAPVFGGWLSAQFGWRSTFIVLTGYGLALILLARVVLQETNLQPDLQAMHPRRMLANYVTLLRDRRYLGALLVGCGAFTALFAFISGSAFVYIGIYRMSPEQMGIAFGANVTGYMISSTLSARYSRRVGSERMILFGAVFGSLAGLLMVGLNLAGVYSLAAVMGPMWLVTFAVGLVLPNSAALGLMDYPRMAGSAASMMGFAQMGLASGVGMVVGHKLSDSVLPLAYAVSGGMLFAWLVWLLLLRRR